MSIPIATCLSMDKDTIAPAAPSVLLEPAYTNAGQDTKLVIKPDTWLTVPITLENKNREFMQKYKQKFNRYIEYFPEYIDESAEPRVIFVLHDAGDQSNNEYYLDGREICEPIKAYTQSLARLDHVPVTLIFFHWSGNDSLGVLQQEAQQLCTVLSSITSHRISLIGYGAGGLVIKRALNLLPDTARDISTVIFLGTPIYEISDIRFIVRKYKTIFNFYATGDLYQGISTLASGSPRKIRDCLQGDVDVYDIRVQKDGREIDHQKLKLVVNRLALITGLIKTTYAYYRDLDMNIAFSAEPEHETHQVQLVIRSGSAIDKINHETSAEQKTAIMNEIASSNSNKDIYKQRYNQDIAQKSSALWRATSGMFSSAAALFKT